MDLYKDNNEVIIERKSKIFVLIARNAWKLKNHLESFYIVGLF